MRGKESQRQGPGAKEISANLVRKASKGVAARVLGGAPKVLEW